MTTVEPFPDPSKITFGKLYCLIIFHPTLPCTEEEKDYFVSHHFKNLDLEIEVIFLQFFFFLLPHPPQCWTFYPNSPKRSSTFFKH